MARPLDPTPVYDGITLRDSHLPRCRKIPDILQILSMVIGLPPVEDIPGVARRLVVRTPVDELEFSHAHKQ